MGGDSQSASKNTPNLITFIDIPSGPFHKNFLGRAILSFVIVGAAPDIILYALYILATFATLYIIQGGKSNLYPHATL